MGSLKFLFSQMGFNETPQVHKAQLNSFTISSRRTLKISCGLRSVHRKPDWRSRVLSTEAIHAVQCLKLAKSPAKLEEVFSSRVSRLLKADLLDTLTELQRQNELELALKVFEFLRKEAWYEPDLSLFSDMIFMLGKKKLIDMVEEIFSELKKEGLEPDTWAYTELIGAYLQVDMVEKAMETYELMKASGFVPDKLTLTILIRNLENVGEEELAATIKRDCAEYLDFPKKFLREVRRKYDRKTGKKIGEGREVDGLYYLNSNIVAAAAWYSEDPFQWNCRLGHPSVEKLNQSVSFSSPVSQFE